MDPFCDLCPFIPPTFELFFSLLLAALIAGVSGYFIGDRKGFGQGYVWGWIARHRGQDGIPLHLQRYISSYRHPPKLAITPAEKELLNDPRERELRGIYPIEPPKPPKKR
jgi:hypothetical protein